MSCKAVILSTCLAIAACDTALAQQGANDTIRLGVITESGKDYPMIFLPDFVRAAPLMNVADRIKRDRLRNNIYKVYPYAMTAAAIFKDVNDNLDKYDARRDRKKYLKAIDKKLDHAFKEPLKNMSVDQGHVLIKLINRQTGQNCYTIIKELKGGFSAMVWQSVGVFFNNNLKKEYDPTGDDKEIEMLVREMEASTVYRYQLYQQQELMKKIAKP
ncbi:MAG: DUF4294 domain-containing protein [Bacteroidota bacterium]